MAWRDRLYPANYRGRPFFIESRQIEGGRRVVQHIIPKKDFPYAEDMGRRPWMFQVRAYLIQYPTDISGTGYPLYVRDYTTPRDNLLAVLDDGHYGELKTPLLPPHIGASIIVACDHYRLTEEEKFGGYCVVDISFVEAGVNPNNALKTDPTSAVNQRINDAFATLQGRLATGINLADQLGASAIQPAPIPDMSNGQSRHQGSRPNQQEGARRLAHVGSYQRPQRR